jgi:glutamine cyclotransferase
MAENSHPHHDPVIPLRPASWMLVIFGIVLLAFCPGCQGSSTGAGSFPETLSPAMTYEVINAYPHDPTAFTQGLIYHNGYLYESTGLYGQSSLRQVELVNGEVLQQVNLPPDTFGEGLTLWEDKLLQLTWREETGFIYDREDFTLLGQFTYPTEGWGLTHDGERLIMTDGSHLLYFIDPASFQVTGSIPVLDQGEPVERLNELEFINGRVFANSWLTDEIVRIDPETGEVLGWVELRGLLPEDLRNPDTDVLNGIAYDPEGNRLWVTGKNWPQLYEIRLVPVSVDD